MKIANAPLDDLRQIVLRACFSFCSLCCDEVVLPGLAIKRVTRPEKGVRTTVLASSLYPIRPTAAVCARNAKVTTFTICS
jgi:hypothetical protein